MIDKFKNELAKSLIVLQFKNMTDSNKISVFSKPEPVLQNQKMCNNFYAIYIPEELKSQYTEVQLIYTDKSECLSVLKKIQGARFKVFLSAEEAEIFTKSCQPTPTKDDRLLVGEKPNIFRSLKSQDLVKFRKAIEKGNLDFFEECIQANPHYLVSKSDTPAILQEGYRYNALHIACRQGQPHIIKRVLSLVSGEEFFLRLYPDDSIASSTRRSCFALDLYLNTPEKGLNETPLHFACKYGAIDCVRELVSYPGCEKNRPNKFNETPRDVICTRSASRALSEAIEELLEDQYYVPVLRDEENCLVPQLGCPWSPSQDGPLPKTSSPLSPSFKVRGFAGPMSPQKAELFYSRWKKSINGSSSSLGSTPSRTSSICNDDLEKGLETMGRDLATEHQVNWSEYWEFLGTFTNLPSEEGIEMLEKHLKRQYRKVVTAINDRESSNSLVLTRNKCFELSEQSGFTSEEDLSIDPFELSQLSSTSIGDICRGLEALRLNTSFSPNNSLSRNSFKFFNTSRDSVGENLISTPFNSSALNRSEKSFTTSYYDYIVQSVQISSDKMSNFLIEAAQSLELHVGGTDYHVTSLLKAKIKRELTNLRDIIVRHLECRAKGPLDLSFIHVLLTSKPILFLVETLPTGDIFLLSNTMSSLSSNIHLYENSFSSDEGEEDTAAAAATDDTIEVELKCVFQCFEKALRLAYELSKKASTNEETIDVKRLGICHCPWATIGGGSETKVILDSQNNNNNNVSKATSSSASKYSRAHFYLNKILFGDRDVDNNSTVVKQLNFQERDENEVEVVTSEKSPEDNEDSESFVSAVSSEEDNEMVTPEEFIKVYINGLLPSKADLQVYFALENQDFDAHKYPNVVQWQKLIASYSQEAKQSWATPRNRPGAFNSPRSDLTFTPRSSRLFYNPNLGQSPL